ncbi:MAG: hypothetical protein HEP71_07030 [Roseivirga sp.]|nr:hypothetical protein [Roseivirga sp.]
MVENLFNTINDFYETYNLGFLWLGIITGVVPIIIDRQKKKRNKRYIRIKGSKAITLPLKPNINWPMSILTAVFGGTGLLLFAVDLVNFSITNDSWNLLAWTFTIFFLWGFYSLRKLSLKFTENELAVNHLHYKASEISKIELWDDLIYIQLKNGEQEKTWLPFRSKHYGKALELVTAVELFCIHKTIPIENHFASDIENNEIFNPSDHKVLS